METGFRHDNVGRPIPRDIITSFVCTYNGETIFEAALYQAIAANPFITFHPVATESGIAFKWTGDNGVVQEGSAKITVGLDLARASPLPSPRSRPRRCSSSPKTLLHERRRFAGGLNLFGANFKGADIRGSQRRHLEGANLNKAILTDAQTAGAKFADTIMPDGRRSE